MDDIVGQILEVNGERKKISKILWDEGTIKARVKKLAEQIANHYKPLLNQEPDRDLVLIGVLNGAIPLLWDLSKELAKHLPISRVRYDTLAISSYREGTNSGELRIEKDLKNTISGDFALIIEDIIDTGYSAEYFTQLLKHKKAHDVQICTLIIKAAGNTHKINPAFVGFKLGEDSFIIGYGLDWANMGRTLSCVASLEDVEE